ncbi:hypothetical protein KSP40_PGU014978 [Platanthera guangdongensis]|uniref:Uncharacterized protein n=1 Tax=Platanthera guangdongensis TaxID=2320717 RepID=A0ABR2LUY0_9ASPA
MLFFLLPLLQLFFLLASSSFPIWRPTPPIPGHRPFKNPITSQTPANPFTNSPRHTIPPPRSPPPGYRRRIFSCPTLVSLSAAVFLSSTAISSSFNVSSNTITPGSCGADDPSQVPAISSPAISDSRLPQTPRLHQIQRGLPAIFDLRGLRRRAGGSFAENHGSATSAGFHPGGVREGSLLSGFRSCIILFSLGFIFSPQSSDPMIRGGKRAISRELTGILDFLEKVLVRQRRLSLRAMEIREGAAPPLPRPRSAKKVSFQEHGGRIDEEEKDGVSRVLEEQVFAFGNGTYFHGQSDGFGLSAPLPLQMEPRLGL